MKRPDTIPEKIMMLPVLLHHVARWKMLGKTIAFTNGVFDIIHKGHLYSLSQAAKEADILIVGVNSDNSVKKLKGDSRPVNDENARALVLASLVMTDAVIIFDEDTPLELVKAIQPNVMVKGGDYKVESIAGAGEVIAGGGRVVINPLIDGISTTGIIEKMKNS